MKKTIKIKATEKHPFGDFVPPNTKYLILGSFTGKRTEEDIRDGYDWFYGTKRNQFWRIVEQAFGTELRTKEQKQDACTERGVAIADIILSCTRSKGSNLDVNLSKIVFNMRGVTSIVEQHRLRTIFFSSRFVEKLFKREFKSLVAKYPEIFLITLPSPSPRHAALTRTEKVALYKKAFEDHW